jgi:hypothetical protein
VAFSREAAPAGERRPEAAAGAVHRRAETGAQVLDIRDMIAELEANPAARKRM